jgi:hypothetical protein
MKTVKGAVVLAITGVLRILTAGADAPVDGCARVYFAFKTSTSFGRGMADTARLVVPS